MSCSSDVSCHAKFSKNSHVTRIVIARDQHKCRDRSVYVLTFLVNPNHKCVRPINYIAF